MYIRENSRIYPKRFQQRTLNQWLGNARFCWNHFLNENIKRYEKEKKFVFYSETANLLVSLKKEEETKWLNESVAQTLQQKLKDLDSALKQSFKKSKNQKGFPRFKSKNTDTSGIRFPQGYKVDFEHNLIKLPKLDGWIKTKFSRRINGIPKSLTLYKDCVGDWFISIVYEIDEKYFEPKVKEIKNAVGIDLGIKSFAVTSDSEVIQNPKFLRKTEKRLKKIQRKHSKKVKGSNNRFKSRKRLAKVHRKIKNQRTNFIKQVASLKAKENDLIVVEDLNVKGMVKNHHLAKSISDCGFSMFVKELEWQCLKRGKVFHKVSRWYPSSKTCNHCGYVKKELTLNEREWVCPQCNSVVDRDYNASLNILKQGLKDLNIP